MTPDTSPFERQLIEECQRGSVRHQEMLYKQFFGFAMGVSLRYTTARDEAMSIVNDSFMKVFATIDRYVFETSFRGWLRRIVVNTALDYYRRSAKYEASTVQLDESESPLAICPPAHSSARHESSPISTSPADFRRRPEPAPAWFG